MYKAKYVTGAKFDTVLKNWLINSVKQRTTQNDDDFLLLIVGETGTGKSTLMLHISDEYLGEASSVDYIGLDRSDHAQALKSAKEKPGLRFCVNDEGNVSKRDSLSKYNKDILDLYLSIRGLNIFHIWANPSLDIIDKAFISERIGGVILITSKSKDKPRIYYYFTKEKILKIFEKHKSLKLSVLKKVRRKYAKYRGWFLDYNGALKQHYLIKKESRMSFKIDDFFKKYTVDKDTIKRSELRKKLDVSDHGIITYEKKLVEKGLIKETDLKRTLTGRVYYDKKLIPLFEKCARGLI